MGSGQDLVANEERKEEEKVWRIKELLEEKIMFHLSPLLYKIAKEIKEDL